MFDPYCPNCDSRVLAGYRQLRSLDNTLDGIVLRFACVCGGEAVLVTGRLAPPAATLVPPPTTAPARSAEASQASGRAA